MIATIGSILLALCGMPEAYKCYVTKSCTLGWPMLIMWLVGELLLVVFAIQTTQYFLLLNYISNLAFLLIMMRYKTD